MPTLPTFSTDEELAAWIDANDTAPYLDEMEDVEEPFVMHRTQFASRDARPNDREQVIQFPTPGSEHFPE